MSLSPGTSLGPYEIVEPLGAGGMGEVYRARDTRLSRDVAIKVLPEKLVADELARARFAQEAKAVAALSHPNIVAIHDIGESDGTAYAVTELLEGQTLAERLQQGAMPARKAVEIATQIAQGLAAAHERDVVHRDLKPANLFVTRDGQVKILDFGLAKLEAEANEFSATQSILPSTEPGTVMGTVGYMSPEQVRAQTADARSDIFSLGVVLYEALGGRPAFRRESAAETMNAILHDAPPEISHLQPSVPGSVGRIVQRCIEKEREERFQSARDLAFALSSAMDASSQDWSPSGRARPVSRSRARARRVPALAALMVLAAAAGASIQSRFAAPHVTEPVLVQTLTFTGQDWSPTISPDDKTIAFASRRDGRARIWLRQMSGGAEAPLTEGPDHAPQFSPDGTSVLFIRDEGDKRSAYRIPVLGGSPRKVLDGALAAAWSPDGTQIAYLRYGGELGRAAEVGIADVRTGEATPLATWLDRFVYGLSWSPDGRSIALMSSGIVMNAGDTVLLVVDVASGETTEMLQRDGRFSAPAWTPTSDALVFAYSKSPVGDTSTNIGRVIKLDRGSAREQLLFWVRSVWAAGGEAVRMEIGKAGNVVFDDLRIRQNLAEIRLPDAGLPGGLPGSPHHLTRGNCIDRQPAYSPDGQSLAFSSNRNGNLDLFIMNTVTGDTRSLTDDEADDWDPAFSEDGQHILWSSNRGGHLEIWMASLDGSGARQVTQDGRDAENPTQAGAWIVYGSGNPEKLGIWKIRPDGSDAQQLLSGGYAIPEISPDGRFVLAQRGDFNAMRAFVDVADVDTGELVFRTELAVRDFRAAIVPGRGRWMPGGDAIAFIAHDEQGRAGVFQQQFVPGEDTHSTRRLLSDLTEIPVESFDISPDGSRLTVSRHEAMRSVKIAVGVPGVN